MKQLLLCMLFPCSLCAQVLNGDFEEWDSTYANIYSYDLREYFGVPDPVGGVLDHWVSSSGFGVSRTTDSYSGDYSLILHNWYGYANEWMYYDESIEIRPEAVTGYYKYEGSTVNGLPHGYAYLSLTRQNGGTNDTIATAFHVFDTAGSFIPFSIPFVYRSSLIPDSIHMSFLNSDRSCDTAIVCNFLYLDALQLNGVILASDQADQSDDLVQMYPNPVQDEIVIINNSEKALAISFYNSVGILVREAWIEGKSESINLSALLPDVYYYKLVGEKNPVGVGMLIKL